MPRDKGGHLEVGDQEKIEEGKLRDREADREAVEEAKLRDREAVDG